MLKSMPGSESLRHICDGFSKQGRSIEIYLHDVQGYAIVRNIGAFQTSGSAGNIKFCPYCGVEIGRDKTERNVYKGRGYKDRNDYLEQMSAEYEVPLDTVIMLADDLGENEDFNGLVNSLEDERRAIINF